VKDGYSSAKYCMGKHADNGMMKERFFKKVLRHFVVLYIDQLSNEWPLYVTLNEDVNLRDAKWKETYSNKQKRNWDNTFLPIMTPSLAELQHNMYSAYYAGKVAKGDVILQLCGWMGACELLVGAVSESKYFKCSGIQYQQQQYLEHHDMSTKESKWCNILDKGWPIVQQMNMQCGPVRQLKFCWMAWKKWNPRIIVGCVVVLLF
jgi:hypothetical protein